MANGRQRAEQNIATFEAWVAIQSAKPSKVVTHTVAHCVKTS